MKLILQINVGKVAARQTGSAIFSVSRYKASSLLTLRMDTDNPALSVYQDTLLDVNRLALRESILTGNRFLLYNAGHWKRLLQRSESALNQFGIAIEKFDTHWYKVHYTGNLYGHDLPAFCYLITELALRARTPLSMKRGDLTTNNIRQMVGIPGGKKAGLQWVEDLDRWLCARELMTLEADRAALPKVERAPVETYKDLEDEMLAEHAPDVPLMIAEPEPKKPDNEQIFCEPMSCKMAYRHCHRNQMVARYSLGEIFDNRATVYTLGEIYTERMMICGKCKVSGINPDAVKTAFRRAMSVIVREINGWQEYGHDEELIRNKNTEYHREYRKKNKESVKLTQRKYRIDKRIELLQKQMEL